jgi:116 kDa U5 small nuclear ribonucleoprotein component
MMDHPSLIRNIALIGNLHHGKTSLVDMLVRETHLLDWTQAKNTRYTDTRFDEQKRKLSIKAMPMSLVLPTLKGKHYLINLMDAPGHVNFSDEQTAAIRLADGVVVVIDAVEGVMAQTARGLRHAAEARVRTLPKKSRRFFGFFGFFGTSRITRDLAGLNVSCLGVL